MIVEGADLVRLPPVELDDLVEPGVAQDGRVARQRDVEGLLADAAERRDVEVVVVVVADGDDVEGRQGLERDAGRGAGGG